MSLSSTISKILSIISHKLKRSPDPQHHPLQWVMYHTCTMCDIVNINLHTKSEVPSYIHSKYDGPQSLKKMGHITMTTPI